tara:strand:- start:774 stop:2021 length:1248 start_codon:yes stop_codon:yes gene_type:complete
MELTDAFIRRLSTDKRREIPDESRRHGNPRRGLVLLANPSGRHAFLFKRMFRGVRFNQTLGTYPELTLAQAREMVDAINDHDGGPGEGIAALFPDEAPDNALTVGRLIKQYIRDECEPHNRDWANQQLVLERELKPYLDLSAERLTTDDVVDVVQRCLDRGSPRTAQEAVKQVRGLYNWAMGRKRVRRTAVRREEAKKPIVRQRLLDIAQNPAEGVSAPQYQTRAHYLSGKALANFLPRLWASDLRHDIKVILAIQLQTFCRVGEVAGMRWDELDLRRRRWVIPGQRYKTGREHVVMLSKQTTALLRRVDRAHDIYVFPMPRRDNHISSRDVAKAINKARDSLKQADEFSSHALRHSGRTWLAEQKCPFEVRERLVGHVTDSASDMGARYEHYDYLAERKEWTQVWCDFLAGIKK